MWLCNNQRMSLWLFVCKIKCLKEIWISTTICYRYFMFNIHCTYMVQNYGEDLYMSHTRAIWNLNTNSLVTWNSHIFFIDWLQFRSKYFLKSIMNWIILCYNIIWEILYIASAFCLMITWIQEDDNDKW